MRGEVVRANVRLGFDDPATAVAMNEPLPEKVSADP
jgi:hypothetical protein